MLVETFSTVHIQLVFVPETFAAVSSISTLSSLHTGSLTKVISGTGNTRTGIGTAGVPIQPVTEFRADIQYVTSYGLFESCAGEPRFVQRSLTIPLAETMSSMFAVPVLTKGFPGFEVSSSISTITKLSAG